MYQVPSDFPSAARGFDLLTRQIPALPHYNLYRGTCKHNAYLDLRYTHNGATYTVQIRPYGITDNLKHTFELFGLLFRHCLRLGRVKAIL